MLIVVAIAWAPPRDDGEERTIVVRASDTVQMYRVLGEALAREADWWGVEPSKEQLTHALRTARIIPEDDDVAAVVLRTPPELTMQRSPVCDDDDS